MLYIFRDVWSLQVWAKGNKPDNASEADVECGESNWGVGANITTKLINSSGEVGIVSNHLIGRKAIDYC